MSLWAVRVLSERGVVADMPSTEWILFSWIGETEKGVQKKKTLAQASSHGRILPWASGLRLTRRFRLKRSEHVERFWGFGGLGFFFGEREREGGFFGVRDYDLVWG